MKKRIIICLCLLLFMVSCSSSIDSNNNSGYCYVWAGAWLHDPISAVIIGNKLIGNIFMNKEGNIEDVISYLDGNMLNLISSNDISHMDMWSKNFRCSITIICNDFNHSLIVEQFDYEDGWNDPVIMIETADGTFTSFSCSITDNNGWYIDNGKYMGCRISKIYAYTDI